MSSEVKRLRKNRKLKYKNGFKHHTFLLDDNLKEEFKEECSINGISMSVAISEFMKGYIEQSKKVRNG